MTEIRDCPHCGAERSVAKIVIEFRCGTAYYGSGVCERDEDCYKRQIEQQAAEIEGLKQAVLDEREACAVIADGWAEGKQIAAEIRARGES